MTIFEKIKLDIEKKTLWREHSIEFLIVNNLHNWIEGKSTAHFNIWGKLLTDDKAVMFELNSMLNLSIKDANVAVAVFIGVDRINRTGLTIPDLAKLYHHTILEILTHYQDYYYGQRSFEAYEKELNQYINPISGFPTEYIRPKPKNSKSGTGLKL